MGKTFVDLALHDCLLVFIDESGFSRNQIRNYAYAPVGYAPTVTVDKLKNENHSCLAALIVGYPFYVEVIVGACDSERFYEFCRNLVAHLFKIIPRSG